MKYIRVTTFADVSDAIAEARDRRSLTTTAHNQSVIYRGIKIDGEAVAIVALRSSNPEDFATVIPASLDNLPNDHVTSRDGYSLMFDGEEISAPTDGDGNVLYFPLAA